MLTEVKGAQHDIEAQQIDKQIPHIIGQPQVIGLFYGRQRSGTAIRRGNLIGGHTREDGIGPSRALTRTIIILCTLLTQSDAG